MKKGELIKLLSDAECYIIREGANHEIWYSPITNRRFTVPRHKGQDITIGTANSILKSAGLK